MFLKIILGTIPLLWLVLNQQGEGGTNQGGSQGHPPQPQPSQGGGPQTPPQGGGHDWQQALNNLIQRQGGVDATAQLLYHENARHRERIRQLEQQLPGEGAVVLTGDQAQAWQTYSQLGNPNELQQQLEQAQQATTELAGLRRAEQVRSVAEAAGYKPGVLQKLAEGLTLDLREQQVEGQTARVPVVVTGEGQQQQATPLADYAQQHWADFLPALQAQGGPQQSPAQGGQGTTYPRQQGNGGQPASNYVGSYFERAYGKKEQ
jgi:hypothetical protein